MRRFWMIFLVLAGLSLVGCSDGGKRHSRDSDAMNPPASLPPTMQAETRFFSEQLLVVATLSPSLNSEVAGPDGGRHSGAGRGLHRRRREESAENSGDESTDTQPLIRESPFPLISLRLHLTNTNADPVEVVFVECDSPLGDFVVHPEKATIPGNGNLDTEPMNSRLGISGEAIPVTIALRKNGKTERKILTLKAIVQAGSR